VDAPPIALIARIEDRGDHMSGWFDEGTEDDTGSEAHSEPHRSAREERADADSAHEDPAGDDRGRERYRVRGDDLLGKVKQIVREGNVRKITIRKEDDEILLSFPLTAGVLGAALLPMWAAIGAVAALVGNCSIDVERRE
jgi:hypothetical protein